MFSKSPPWRFVLRNPIHFAAFGFGSGMSPFAPGTVGTLVAFPIYWALVQLGMRQEAYLALIFFLFVIGIWFCEKTGSALGVADHNGIVWDEIVAFLLILHFTPQTLNWFVVAFFVFRIFDVWKPFPIRHFDSTIKNGFGVMLDDLLAAIYSLAVIVLLDYYF